MPIGELTQRSMEGLSWGTTKGISLQQQNNTTKPATSGTLNELSQHSECADSVYCIHLTLVKTNRALMFE